MDRQRTLERERRWARPAAAAAILIAPLYLIAMALDPRGLLGAMYTPARIRNPEFYRDIEASGGEIFVAVAVRGLAFLLAAAALLYLFNAARARSDRVSGVMAGFAFIGPVLLAFQGVAATLAQRRLATDFVAEAERGGDIFTLIIDLVDESTGIEFASSVLIPATLGMLVAMIYIPLQAMRVGLLTRFLGTLGMALGAGLVFIALPLALLTIAFWFLWLGLVIANRNPGPRPPAWDAGVAIPWPKPGEEPPAQESGEGEELVGELLEFDGNGAAPDADRDHSARRERAKKRKRKRRR